MRTVFTNEEMMVLMIYESLSREECIGRLNEVRSFSEEDGDQEMLDLVQGILDKLRSITDEEYLAMDYDDVEIYLNDGSDGASDVESDVARKRGGR